MQTLQTLLTCWLADSNDFADFADLLTWWLADSNDFADFADFSDANDFADPDEITDSNDFADFTGCADYADYADLDNHCLQFWTSLGGPDFANGITALWVHCATTNLEKLWKR